MLSKVKKESYIKDSTGQILLFVVITMSMALAVGIAISARTLQSMQRTSRTDTSSRAASAAEGGVELFTMYPDHLLQEVNLSRNPLPADLLTACQKLNPNFELYNVPGEDMGCLIKYANVGDGITSSAIVSVKTFNSNYPSGYKLDIANGNTAEINLRSDYTDPASSYTGNINVCWSDKNVQLYVMFYGEPGISQKDFLAANDSTVPLDSRFDTDLLRDNVTKITPNNGEYCQLYTPSYFSKQLGMRIKALGASTEVHVKPNNSPNLPPQGFEITSEGHIETQNNSTVVKVIRAYRSYGFLPGVFENAVYSEGQISP